MKKDKIIYWVITGLFCAWMLAQSVAFLFNTDEAAILVTGLGFPAWIIKPLGIAKFLAVLAILTNLSPLLKKLAYLGLAINFIVALVAHLISGDSLFFLPIIALVLGYASYYYYRKIS